MDQEIDHRDGEAVIVTRVSEILTSIQKDQASGFARVELSLSGKADKGDIIRLETTVREHGDRLITLEQERHARQTEAEVHAIDSHKLLTTRQARVALLGIVAVLIEPIVARLVG